MSPSHDPEHTSDQKHHLKIIGAGFGRTGTLSLKTALEELGFGPCYHMVEVFEHPEHLKYWLAATNKQPLDWNNIFANYEATVDWPGCTFYAELMRVYPEALVILTVRDPNKWHESVVHTIYSGSMRTPLARLVMTMVGIISPSLRKLRKMHNSLIWEGTFHGRTSDKEYATTIFQQHNEEVQRIVPPEKLLVFQVKDGWEPLCAFLGVPVPDGKPFPHVNDRASWGKPDPEHMPRNVITFRVARFLRFIQQRRN